MPEVNATRGSRLTARLWGLGCCLLLSACTARGCGGDPDGGESPLVEATLPPPAFTLAIVTDLKGYLEPCGCTSRPLGGIDRVAARIAATRAAGPTLTLMAGDLFFSGQSHGPHAAAHGAPDEGAPAADGANGPSFAARAQAGQDALNAEAVADVVARFEVAAALPGAHDRAEPQALEALATRARLPLLGREASDAVRREVAGRTVLVLGITEEEPRAAADATRALLDAPANATRDLVVVLTRGGRRTARAVAQVAGVHVVVLGGADVDEALPPGSAGDALVLHASRQGQGVTVAGIYLPPPGTAPASPIVDVSPWSAAARRTTLEADIEELSASLARWEQEGADAQQIARQRGRLSGMQAELAGVVPPALPPDQLALAATFFELPPDAPQDAEVTAAMEALARRVNEHNRVALADWAPEPVAAGEPHYLGSAACESCHSAAYTWWRGHPHGRAYSTLEVRHKQFNLSCVGCHVTGYLQPGGSTVTQLGDGALINVGCENCHGPGSAHVASGGSVAPARRDVPASVCTGCHNPEHSDRFLYDAFRRTLLVPGHGLPAAGGPP
ncbi:MAG: cytochrome c family protein [Sandaracinaceae bacterium]|nr:cytochrome c family protein [Sandaracinaceae bacterium]